MNPWLVLGGFVLAYDSWLIATGRASLTSKYQYCSQHHPVVTATATAYLVAHLHSRVPRHADVFNLVSFLASRRTLSQT